MRTDPRAFRGSVFLRLTLLLLLYYTIQCPFNAKYVSILEQTAEENGIPFRAMMGEYILYYRSRVFGGIYDDRLLVKPVPAAVKMMPDATMEPPYDGAKEMILVDDVDSREFLCELVESMWEELPERKKKLSK